LDVRKKENNEWGEPTFCVNGMYVTTSANSNVYTSNIHQDTEGISKFQYQSGKYLPEEQLKLGGNLAAAAVHPCIAADESFIIFDSKVSSNPNRNKKQFFFHLVSNLHIHHAFFYL